MRKTLFSAVCCLGLAASAQAQVGTGLFAGGSLGFGMGSSSFEAGGTTVDGPKTSSFSIMPRVGYFLTDNIGVGLVFGYGSNSSKTTVATVETKSVDNMLNVGLFGRYAMPLGDEGNFNLIGDLNVGFSSTSGETTAGGTSAKDDPSSTIGVGIAPGILFFPTSKIGLEAGLGNLVSFNSTTVTDADNSDTKTKSTSLSFLSVNTLGFNFGLNYYFGR